MTSLGIKSPPSLNQILLPNVHGPLLAYSAAAELAHTKLGCPSAHSAEREFRGGGSTADQSKKIKFCDTEIMQKK